MNWIWEITFILKSGIRKFDFQKILEKILDCGENFATIHDLGLSQFSFYNIKYIMIKKVIIYSTE